MAALTGQLLADFSDFTRAVDTAVVTLKSFETGAGQVDKSLTRMVDNFSGRKVIQDATLMAEAVEKIGGVSKLTEEELARVSAKATEAADKLRAMGKDVPAGIQQIADASKQAETATGGWADSLGKVNNVLGLLGIGVTAAGFVSLGKALFEDADTLERLSDRTAIGVETLQRFRVAGNDAGVSLEAMANGMNKLQKNLSEGTTATTDALGTLHLNLADIRKLSPEDQFYAIAKAIGEVQNPAEQVELAIKLFGKAGAELLPVIKRGFDDVKDSAVGMSRATVEALDHGGDAWTKYVGIVKAQAGEMLADALTGTTSLQREAISEAENLADVFKRIGVMAAEAAPKLKTYGLELPSITAAEHDLQKAEAERAAAEKLFAGAMEELTSVGTGWLGTLQTIDGAVVEAIKYYLEAGVAQDKLATAYGLTAAQVKSVAAAMKDADEALKLQATSVAEATKLWDEYDALRVQHGGTATDAQIAQIDRWYQDTVAKLQLAGTYNEQTATAVWSVWQEKLAGVNVQWDDVRKHSKESLQEIADKARATADYVLANSGDFTAAYIRHKEQEAEAAERAAYHWRDTFDEADRKSVV